MVVNMSKMATRGGRSNRLPPNIFVCHMINMNDRFAILFFKCLLLSTIILMGINAVKISKMAASKGPSLTIGHIINISDRNAFFSPYVH